MPINYKKYAENWKTEIRPDILSRANDKCEKCGVKNYSIRNGSKIVLTIAHLDHNIKNNDYRNLQALCQRCHIRYDKHLHYINAQLNKIKKLESQGTNVDRVQLIKRSVTNYIDQIEDIHQKTLMKTMFLKKKDIL